MRLQGKSYKEIKEAFIDLRASYQYSQKQLDIARESRDENSREISKLKRKIAYLNSKLEKVKANSDTIFKNLKEEHSNLVKDLSKNLESTSKKAKYLEERLAYIRQQRNSIYRIANTRKLRVSDLLSQLKECKNALKKATASLEKSEKLPKIIIKEKAVREKVFVDKVVKEPIPDKMRQLMSTNTITQSKMDILLVATALLNFSDKTKLTLRQIVLLLEANNLGYFTNKQLLTQSPFTIKELEYKQLVSGDRSRTKRAIGWFITKKGKRVAEMLLKKVYNNNLKRQYLKYEN